eukprot:6683277-Pyramimonas_sp.AAC.1
MSLLKKLPCRAGVTGFVSGARQALRSLAAPFRSNELKNVCFFGCSAHRSSCRERCARSRTSRTSRVGRWRRTGPPAHSTGPGTGTPEGPAAGPLEQGFPK